MVTETWMTIEACMNELISIIVPVYAVEKYLERCVNSILNQTYGNIEVILVDDGSPDNCPMMCDDYALKDPRITVIHKKNGGLSDARNAGLAIARGSYVGFVDSDDFIKPTMYQKLYEAIKNANADMSICMFDYVDETGNLIVSKNVQRIHFDAEVLKREQMFDRISHAFVGYYYFIPVCSKLYKKAVFDHIHFPAGVIHEDEFVIHHLIDRCNCVAVVAERLYEYVQRSDSIMHSDIFTTKRLNAVDALIDRYFFYTSKNRNDLALDALKTSYWTVLDFMNDYKGLENAQKEVEKRIRIILKQQLIKKDIRFIKLILSYLAFVIRSALKSKQKIID